MLGTMRKSYHRKDEVMVEEAQIKRVAWWDMYMVELLSDII